MHEKLMNQLKSTSKSWKITENVTSLFFGIAMKLEFPDQIILNRQL
jgi:hypothetical protein